MNLLSWLKAQNQQFASSIIRTETYWKHNPASILLQHYVSSWPLQQARFSTILDAGAGRLAYKQLLAQHTTKYLSTDMSANLPVDLVSSVESLPLAPNSVDLVFCSQVLEHVPHPWIAIQEFERVLKPGGTLLITVPFQGYLHNAPHDYFRFTHFALKQLMKDAGLEIKEIQSLGGFFCFLGYIRSTIIMPLFGLPIIGHLLFKLNYLLSRLDIVIDRFTKSDKVLALNYACIAQKPV